jgi:hypothetical protein
MDMPKLTVHFACPHCGALFTAAQEHQPGAGTFECTQFGWLVHEWSGPYNFIDWERASQFRDHDLGRPISFLAIRLRLNSSSVPETDPAVETLPINHPFVRRDLLPLGQLDHPNGRRVTALLARPAF